MPINFKTEKIFKYLGKNRNCIVNPNKLSFYISPRRVTQTLEILNAFMVSLTKYLRKSHSILTLTIPEKIKRGNAS